MGRMSRCWQQKDDNTDVDLNCPIYHQRKDAVCDLRTVFRNTEKIPDISHLGDLVLSLVGKVAGKQWLEGGRAGGHEGDQVS